MSKEQDPFRKYVDDLGNRKWRCKFCGNKFAGSTPRIRAHFAGIPGKGIKACEKVDDTVKAEALQAIEGRGSVLDTSTVGTSGEGTEGTVVGTTQSVLPSVDASNRLGCAPQQTSFDPPTGTGTAPACPQVQEPLHPTMPQDLIDRLASPSFDISALLDFSEQSSHDASTPDAPPDSDQSILHDFLPENLRESVAKFFEDIEADELHNPEELDGANRLQGCGQPLGVEEVPVPSNRSPTNIVQQSGQLPPGCDKEDGNDIRRFPSPTRMEIDPSSASLNTSDSRILEATMVDSLVVEASTDTVGPSSSHALVPPSSSQAPHNAPPSPQILPCGIGLIGPSSLPELDMNEGAPMTSHPNTEDNFEENRALKRKLKLLYSKRAIIRDELEFAASLSLKKPRMEVVNWLANVEKLRNDCPEAAKEDCLPPHQQVDILMHEVEDLMRQGKGLFEVRETKVNKLLEDEMVGEAFQRNTTKILGHLVGNQISRLGIYGMGGVGKTTIMVHIHNRLLEEANYGNVLWITVSQDFNTESLQDAIWKELGLGILQEKDVRRRAAMLCDCLMKRGKSTIIFDDVWERFDLKEVGIPVRADGIKLVLTTRSIEVCRHMQCQEMIKIEPLSHKEAESLFWEELKLEVALKLETKVIVKSIVKECAGLPLAVITMATSMRGVTDVFEWKDCLKKLRESDMGQTDMEKVVLKRLEFNYNRLGKHEVQQCFLSCALYPEDKLIDKFELIEFFIDQGLFGQLETREEQYCRGRTILNKLANVCLLEDHGSVMKMHDLIRDMALHVMSAISIVKAGKGLKRIPYEEYWTDALEKVSLMENDIREFPLNMSPNCPKLSTFLLNKSLLCDVVIPDSFFKQLWGLKVLNLSGCKLRELPNSISDLVHLTVLSLGFCHELHCIPYLGKLRYLRKLDVFSCVKLEAIKGLEMLVNLTFLDIAYTRIKRLPKGTLEALLKLQYLSVQAVNEEDITKLWALETLDCQFEDVDDFNKLVRVVSKQENSPRYYELNICQGRLEIYRDLSGEVRFGNRERSVHIETRSHAIVSAGGESNGGGICILIPEDVQKLTASNCDGVTNLSDIGPLENLEELDIDNWKNLRVLCGGQDEIINTHDSPAPTPTPTPTPLPFPSLRVLEFYQCPKLKYLFGHGPIFSLPHLQEIKINECKEMVGIIVAVTSPPPHQPPAFLSLEHIFVFRCNKIKRVVESEGLPYFPNLRKIDVSYCENMEEIIGGPSPYMPVEEISLEVLHVHGCHNMTKLFPHELLLHFQNLQDIRVSDCKGMVEILSGARQGQEGSIMTPVNKTLSSFQSSIYLPKLYSLSLSYLPQLKSICEVPITCHSLELLEVLRGGQDKEIIDIHDSPAPTLFLSLRKLSLFNCPKLKYLFEHGPKFFLPHLQDIDIDECEEMVGITSPSPQPPSAFPSLEVITIRKCDKMKRAVESEWLPHCPNLREIALIYCENMEEIFGGPPPYVLVEEISLEWLWVEECHNMRKLFPHEWMLYLQNLRTIDVTRCKGMVKMISGAGQGQEGSITTPVNNTPSFSQSSISLPKLNCLFLRNLPQLKSICEVPITCDSMEGLVVSECPELNRIPLQLRLRDIKDLPYIEVEGEENWKTLIWDHPNAQTILQSHLRFDGARFILEGQGISKSSAKWMRISPVLILKNSEERPSDATFVTRARFPANSQVAI